MATTPRDLIRPALADLQPYQPGKPIEEVQRELGLERVVKLASNEGAFGPFPAALEALERLAPELNRYPDGGAFRLRRALAARLDVPAEAVALGAGADGIIDGLAQATLEAGDEVVSGWPSFPSYVIYARKLGADARLVPMREGAYDLDGLLDAITPRTRLVAICDPNNPTGRMTPRSELARFLDAVPEHVLTVLDQAYWEYVAEPEYANAIEDFAKLGRRVLVLRTFSKIFGLAGLRIGYGVGPLDVVAAIDKVRRPFDLTSAGQEMALASLGDAREVARRRASAAAGRTIVANALADAGFAVTGPPAANFVYADVGEDAGGIFEALLREGVIVRPLHGFGAPTAIRVTVGTAEENALLAGALSRATTAVS
jgi:histidinol-phosphate aminotransferase